MQPTPRSSVVVKPFSFSSCVTFSSQLLLSSGFRIYRIYPVVPKGTNLTLIGCSCLLLMDWLASPLLFFFCSPLLWKWFIWPSWSSSRLCVGLEGERSSWSEKMLSWWTRPEDGSCFLSLLQLVCLEDSLLSVTLETGSSTALRTDALLLLNPPTAQLQSACSPLVSLSLSLSLFLSYSLTRTHTHTHTHTHSFLSLSSSVCEM